jgi:hypothetical protein
VLSSSDLMMNLFFSEFKIRLSILVKIHVRADGDCILWILLAGLLLGE